MSNTKKSILIISSANPLEGPGVIAIDLYLALSQVGADVDLLTKFPVAGHPEYLYVKEKDTFWDKIANRIRHTLLRQKRDYYFFYKKEIHPPVPSQKVLAKITKPYDIVCVIFWQGLLSFKTIEAIYDKLKCTITFHCVDYSPMSGGCHFTGTCERYQSGCGACPGIGSNNEHDFTAWNVKYRKIVYDKVKPILFCNNYMHQFFQKSLLLKDAKTVISWPIINTELFRPLNRRPLMQKNKINENKDFIVFFGCQNLNDERKGMKLLIEALNIFSKQLSDEQRKKVLLMAAGNNFSTIAQMLPFDSKDFGFVDAATLPELYSMADVFVCPSVNDAGPMMVNQALCCGTPVVGFEMGACLQAVKGQGTGYCAALKDVDDLANGIAWMHNLTQTERNEMRSHCRNFAIKHHSYMACANLLLDTIENNKSQ